MFRRISPKKISEEIIEQFKSMLTKGELKPGDALPSERELADLIGVSRPPLREALNALQAMGFIEIKPRRKIIVRSLVQGSFQDPIRVLIQEDLDKLFELLEIRQAMEGWAAYNAALRATPEDLQRLKSIVQTDQRNLKSGKDDAKTDADFHVAISLAAHNTLFSHLIASFYHLLWDTQKMSRERIFRRKGNYRFIGQQHLRIFEAIRDRDAERAGKEAREHIAFVESEIRNEIESRETTKH